jgi:hypothetical protein
MDERMSGVAPNAVSSNRRATAPGRQENRQKAAKELAVFRGLAWRNMTRDERMALKKEVDR